MSVLKSLLNLSIAALLSACGQNADRFWFNSVPHPQMPKQRDYVIEPVEVVNPIDGIRLAAELTYREDVKNPTAVVLISGADGGPPATMDYEITGHHYFLVLSDLLTRQGFAVLRFDNRGVGNSSGDYSTATDDDYASDAAALLAWLKTDSGLNPSKAGFIGHSQGGNKALLASRLQQPDYIVTMGTGVQSLKEVIITQHRDISRAINSDLAESERQVRELKDIFAMAEASVSLQDYQAAMRSYLLEQGVTDEKRQQEVMATYGSKWWYTETRRDVEQIHRDFDGPLLQLFGTKDLLVSIDANQKRAREVAVNTESEMIVFEGLNHLFQTAVKGTGPMEYWEIQTTIEPQVVEAMINWISGLGKAVVKRLETD